MPAKLQRTSERLGNDPGRSLDGSRGSGDDLFRSRNDPAELRRVRADLASVPVRLGIVPAGLPTSRTDLGHVRSLLRRVWRPSDLFVPISGVFVTSSGFFPAVSRSSPPISRSSGGLRELRTVRSKFRRIGRNLQSLRTEVRTVPNPPYAVRALRPLRAPPGGFQRAGVIRGLGGGTCSRVNAYGGRLPPSRVAAAARGNAASRPGLRQSGFCSPT